MLFRIESSVVNRFKEQANTQNDVVGLDILAQSSADGMHMLSGARSELLYLASVEGISRRAKWALQRAAREATFSFSQGGEGGVLGRIVMEGERPQSKTVGNMREIIFPLRWFESTDRIQATLLLCENMSDARAIYLIGMTGAFMEYRRFVNISVEKRGGGGSTIANELREIVNSGNQLCLCFADSDRDCPEGSVGGTFGNLLTFRNDTNFPLVGVESTTGRDLENHLPDKCFESLYPDQSRGAEMTKCLKYLAEIRRWDIRSHIDIEKGIKLRSHFDRSVGSRERMFWDAALVFVLKHVGKELDSFVCFSTGKCASNSLSECGCVVLNGNRSNILDEFVERFGGSSPFEMKKLVSDDVGDEWARVGRLVVGWAISDKKMRL